LEGRELVLAMRRKGERERVMKKGELIEALRNWPDDAEIEIAIPHDLDSKEPMMEDKIWLEIGMVEETNPDPVDINLHCLLFAGRQDN